MNVEMPRCYYLFAKIEAELGDQEDLINRAGKEVEDAKRK